MQVTTAYAPLACPQPCMNSGGCRLALQRMPTGCRHHWALELSGKYLANIWQICACRDCLVRFLT
jgi:hypothetical protein